jgi:hypothetical protein
MVTGDNKGHVYEKKIVKILKERMLIAKGTYGAGSGPGTDVIFIHKGKNYKLEIKNSVTAPDYGQKRLIPYQDGKKWRWNWAPKVIDEKITKYYTKIGVLDYLNKKKIIPNKYRKVDSELTYQDVKEDQKNFEDVTYYISDETIGRFYEDKANYIQIGNGYGLYHPKTDKAKLGTEKFHGKFFLRFRAKRHTTKNFHCYSFFAVIKCKGLDKKSRCNIEETDDQKFPPIKP